VSTSARTAKHADAVYLQFGMIRTPLTDASRSELQSLRRTNLPAKVRDRVEMVLLSDAGWSAPRIADHLGYCGHTVRGVLRDFLGRGTPALYPRKTGPAPDTARRERVTDRLRRLLDEDRTWTARQLADALRPQGIDIGPRQARRYLRLLRAGYRRTASTLGHKQDPAKVARAEGVLAGLRRRAAAGRLRLYYLDECGFSPSLPTGYSWCLPGQRKRVRYEYPQGRRVNALAAYEPFAVAPWLGATPFERTLTSDDLLAYLRSLPPSPVPRVVVLDNASLHVSKVTKAARPGLAKAGLFLYYLPPYSPELNRIEAVFKQVKHHEMPTRSHTSKADLRVSVEHGFDSYRRSLLTKGEGQSRLAA
jgi:putative transposase